MQRGEHWFEYARTVGHRFHAQCPAYHCTANSTVVAAPNDIDLSSPTLATKTGGRAGPITTPRHHEPHLSQSYSCKEVTRSSTSPFQICPSQILSPPVLNSRYESSGMLGASFSTAAHDVGIDACPPHVARSSAPPCSSPSDPCYNSISGCSSSLPSSSFLVFPSVICYPPTTPQPLCVSTNSFPLRNSRLYTTVHLSPPLHWACVATPGEPRG